MSKDKRRLSLKKFFSDGKFTTNNKKDLTKVDYNDNDTKISIETEVFPYPFPCGGAKFFTSKYYNILM